MASNTERTSRSRNRAIGAAHDVISTKFLGALKARGKAGPGHFVTLCSWTNRPPFYEAPSYTDAPGEWREFLLSRPKGSLAREQMMPAEDGGDGVAMFVRVILPDRGARPIHARA